MAEIFPHTKVRTGHDYIFKKKERKKERKWGGVEDKREWEKEEGGIKGKQT